ncbi:MAG: hypothetical protein BGO13_10905 [Burkholderiales bacterium 66-5]|nr:MAG: hypothetical protein BGO13_10905 [Burkholderiales bacterium 66-5]
MDPQIIQCATDCTVTVIHEFALPVLNMSTADAASISSAVLLVWVVGFSIRMLIRTLNSGGDSLTKED